MSDTGDFFYITHANGLSWFELGAEGTLDVFSTNSINLRTQGDINLHADRDINMFAGRDVKVKSDRSIFVESKVDIKIAATEDFKLYSKKYIGVKSDGTLALDSKQGSWAGGSGLVFKAGSIDLNGPAAPPVQAPNPITTTKMDDTKFVTGQGWVVDKNALLSIVSRAPTHEPYPYHNKGVDVKISLEEGKPPPPPGAIPVPAGVEITRQQ
jgi:hypothetical protein